MKTTIYYFTGTGNSLVVARDIGAALGETQLVSIPKALKTGIPGPVDSIGVVFPVYIWGMPLVIEEFIKKLKASDAKYFFAVCTYGGMPAATMPLTEKAFKAAGIKMSAGFGVKMPGNYTPMYGAISEEKQKKMFAVEKEKVKLIAQAVKENRAAAPEKNNFIVNAIFTDLIYGFSAKHIPEMDKTFFADEKCDGCGICAKVCPAENIDMKSGKPSWRHKCYQCLACLQWCPKEAIQCGKSTANRKRYRHPDVKLNDLL